MRNSIYTRTGDKGRTSLVGGARLPKDALRVEAYGTVDEANSWVGVARACTTHPVLWEGLDFLQHKLFNCSSNLATPPEAEAVPPEIADADVEYLEKAIDHFEGKSGALTHFILPGGNQCAAYLHVARTVIRRAERRIISLGKAEAVDPQVIKFVNRASDFLFAAARYSNYLRSKSEVAWKRDCPPPVVSWTEPPSGYEDDDEDEGCEGCKS